jgi:hypothetical protein
MQTSMQTVCNSSWSTRGATAFLNPLRISMPKPKRGAKTVESE